MKDIKKNQRQILEPKVLKTKHSLDKLSGRMKMTEKTVSELEDRLLEIIQYEENGGGGGQLEKINRASDVNEITKIKPSILLIRISEDRKVWCWKNT